MTRGDIRTPVYTVCNGIFKRVEILRGTGILDWCPCESCEAGRLEQLKRIQR